MSTPATNKLLPASGVNNIMCGVCGHCYRLPRLLPCLHTFCSECILNLKTYPIINDPSLSRVIADTADWSSIRENNSDNFRNTPDIVKPPVQFESPDFYRRTLPRSRSDRTKAKKRTPKTNSFCDKFNIEEVEFRYSSQSLNTSRDVSRGNTSELLTPTTSFTSNGNTRARQDTSSGDQKRIIMCPQCWTEVHVSTSLHELPRNLIAERRVAEEARLHPGTNSSCDLCSHSGNRPEDDQEYTHNTVTARCVECAANLCSFCQESHNRQTKTKLHNLINLQPTSIPETNRKPDNTFPDIFRDGFIPREPCLFPDGPESLTSFNSPQLPLTSFNSPQLPLTSFNSPQLPLTSFNSPQLPLTSFNSPQLPSLLKFQCLLWDDINFCKVPDEEEVLSQACDDVDSCHNHMTAVSERESVSLQPRLGHLSGHPGATTTSHGRAVRCLAHTEKQLDMFCVTCEQNVCVDCVVLAHLGHDCQIVNKQLFKNQMEDVDRVIQAALPRVKDVDDELMTLTQIKVAATELSNNVKDEINTFMDTFVEAVEKHRKQLLAQVKSLVEEQERPVSLAQWRLQQTRADVQLTCSFLEELLASASDIEILSFKKLLTRRLMTLTVAAHEPLPQLGRLMRFCPTAKGDIINKFQMFGRVIVNQASPDVSFIHGEGLTTASVARRATMILTVLDHDGVPYTESDVTVEARVVHKGQEVNVPITYKHLEDGNHQVDFVPVHHGTHQLHVLLNGCSIKDSPFTFKVKPKWRRHVGIWQSTAARPSDGRQEDARASGDHRLGLPVHCAGYFWSCCGTMTYSSDCPGHSCRSSPLRQATV